MLSACSYVYADKFTAYVHSNCPPPERTHVLSRTRHCGNKCVDDILFNAYLNVQQTLSQFVRAFGRQTF